MVGKKFKSRSSGFGNLVYFFKGVYIVLLSVILLSLLSVGCGPIIKLDYSSRLIGNAKCTDKFYVSEVQDVRPDSEKRGTVSIINMGWGRNVCLPLPEVAFEPMPPEAFLRRNLLSGIEEIAETTYTADSADYVISCSLEHLSISRRPSTLAKISGCTAMGSSLLSMINVFFGEKTGSGFMLTLGIIPVFSSLGMAASRIEYVGNMKVTINLNSLKGDTAITKSFSSEKNENLGGWTEIEHEKFVNSLFQETMDEILLFLIDFEEDCYE